MSSTSAAQPSSPSDDQLVSTPRVVDQVRQLIATQTGQRSSMVSARVLSADQLTVRSAADVVATDEPIASMFAHQGPQRGEVGVIVGSTSLMLALLARPSRSGSWCVIVGASGLGLAAAQQAGVDLDRLVMIPSPGAYADQITAALLDAFDVVVWQPSAPIASAVARRLATITRRCRGLLIVNQPDSGVGATVSPQWTVERARWSLRVIGRQWEGITAGQGHLQRQRLDVEVARKDGAMGRIVTVTLPTVTQSSTGWRQWQGSGVGDATDDVTVIDALKAG